jgi:protein-tyrosine phosphatase
MIDCHSHVLPGIDDGTKEIDEAVAFCRLAADRGTEVLIATPHHKAGSYANPRPRILERVEDLQKRIDEAGIPLRIAPGCEIFVDTGLPERVKSGELLTYGDAGRYILLEFSFQQYPVNPENLIFQLRLASVTPVIAHPERIRYFQEGVERLEALVRLGALAQITTSSLDGTFGSKVRDLTERMVRRRLVHLLASDAHDLSYRPPGLETARRRLEALVGEEEAGRMVAGRPAALLDGREIAVEPPIDEEPASRRRRFFGLFG